MPRAISDFYVAIEISGKLEKAPGSSSSSSGFLRESIIVSWLCKQKSEKGVSTGAYLKCCNLCMHLGEPLLKE
jgi:mevalonate pyrophosphate decarboxylase